jgi:hypothetical protein
VLAADTQQPVLDDPLVGLVRQRRMGTVKLALPVCEKVFRSIDPAGCDAYPEVAVPLRIF